MSKSVEVECCTKVSKLDWSWSKDAFTQDTKQEEAKVGYLREWSLSSHSKNRATIHQQVCLT